MVVPYRRRELQKIAAKGDTCQGVTKTIHRVTLDLDKT